MSVSASSAGLTCHEFYGARPHSTYQITESARRLAQSFRTAMVRDYLHLEVTTQKERAEFMASHIQSPDPKRLVIEFENSRLKFLNDVLNDKDLITSIDNFANSYISHRIKGWVYGHFDLGVSIKTYSDGKSLTMIIDFKKTVTEEDLERVNSVFEKFQSELGHLLKSRKMFRDSDQVEEWFRMGVGRTSDEAYFSARVSRKLAGPNQVKHFSNYLIQAKLRTLLFHAEDSRTRISERAELLPLLQIEETTGKLIPKLELFDILRKVSDAAGIKKAVQENLHIEISKDGAELLSLYAEIIDLLNPKFFVVDQSVVTLSNAVNGGIVVDRKGMGSANQMATAIATAKSNSPLEFLMFNRVEESKVTNEINEYRRSMEKDWGAKCRGDDCVIEDISRIDIKAFLNSDLIKGQRVVIIPAGIADGHSRSEMSTHGETIEKLFVKQLVKVVSPEIYKGLTFAVDFKTTEMSSGAVSLIVNPLNGSVEIETQKHISQSFQNALSEFNLSRAKQNKASTYYPAQVVTVLSQ